MMDTIIEGALKEKKLEFVRNVSRFEIILCHKIAEEKTILEDIKMKVEVATDREVALKCIKRVPADYYDLVLMDIQMPRMNGHVAKPIEIRKLMKTLAGILR
ncbi:MAG: response regulator [Dorea sp.]